MSHGTGTAERRDGSVPDGAAAASRLRWPLLCYSAYPIAVCAAIALGRPRWALAATLLALGIAALAQPRTRRLGLLLMLAAAGLPAVPAAETAQPLVFVLPVAINAGLAVVFGRTLRRGREPLITTFARWERGTLPPALASYTRTLTFVWVAFFAAAAIVSALLAAAAPLVVWGAFVAFGNHLFVAALFVGEFAFRRRRFPQYDHASPLALAAIIAKRWRLS